MNFETFLGVGMVAVGLISLWLVISARGKLSETGELKTIVTNCIYVILFLTAYSIWHVLRDALHWKKAYGDIVEYPEYLFISLGFIMIYKTAKTLNNVANMFEKL